jgi:hypothetical protein
MRGETVAASGYDNAAAAQPADEDLAGEDIGAFANLSKAIAVDRDIVAVDHCSISRIVAIRNCCFLLDYLKEVR